MFEFEFLDGKPFSEADLASGIRNVVLSDQMARRIFGRTDVVGQTFKQDFKESKVVGVVREGSYLLPASYGQIYMPYSCLPGYDSNNDGSHKVGTYVVYFKVRQKEDMPKLYAEVNELVRKYNTSQKEYTVDIFHQPIRIGRPGSERAIRTRLTGHRSLNCMEGRFWRCCWCLPST